MRHRLYHYKGIATWIVVIVALHFYSCNQAGPGKPQKKHSYSVITKDSVPDINSIEYLTYCCQNNVKIKAGQLEKFLPGMKVYPDSVRFIFADKTSFTNHYSNYTAKVIHLQKKDDATDFVYLTVFNNHNPIHCELLGINTMFDNGHNERLDVFPDGNRINVCQYYYTGSMDSIMSDSSCWYVQIFNNGKTERNYISAEIKLNEKKKMEFWNYAVKPIINNNKDAVIKTVHFPLEGEWPFMIAGKPDYTQQAFIKYYDKLFNAEVRDLLKKQNYKDIYAYRVNREILYQFSIGKDLYLSDGTKGGEASVIFNYKEIDGFFKLVSIHGAGGSFY